MQAKTLTCIFSITRQQNNLKTIGACTESTDLICNQYFLYVSRRLPERRNGHFEEGFCKDLKN
jgi:hypothetical protein